MCKKEKNIYLKNVFEDKLSATRGKGIDEVQRMVDKNQEEDKGVPVYPFYTRDKPFRFRQGLPMHNRCLQLERSTMPPSNVLTFYQLNPNSSLNPCRRLD